MKGFVLFLLGIITGCILLLLFRDTEPVCRLLGPSSRAKKDVVVVMPAPSASSIPEEETEMPEEETKSTPMPAPGYPLYPPPGTGQQGGPGFPRLEGTTIPSPAQDTPQYRVSGIFHTGGQYSALLEDDTRSYIVKPGDKLGKYRVKSVTPGMIILAYGGNAYKIGLSAAPSASGDRVPGSQAVPGSFGGGLPSPLPQPPGQGQIMPPPLPATGGQGQPPSPSPSPLPGTSPGSGSTPKPQTTATPGSRSGEKLQPPPPPSLPPGFGGEQ